MTTTLNATTSNGLVVTPDNSGNVLLQYNGVAAPAFSAYLNTATQSVSSNTWTKVNLNAEVFDTANYFDSTTNYRFTPLVAGYYQISGCVYGDATVTNPASIGVAIYKNGTNFKQNLWAASGASSVGQSSVSTLVYLNGSTDYIELYGRLGNGSGVVFLGDSSYQTYMSGCLLRGA